jgi:hypothetical protein
LTGGGICLQRLISWRTALDSSSPMAPAYESFSTSTLRAVHWERLMGGEASFRQRSGASTRSPSPKAASSGAAWVIAGGRRERPTLCWQPSTRLTGRMCFCARVTSALSYWIVVIVVAFSDLLDIYCTILQSGCVRSMPIEATPRDTPRTGIEGHRTPPFRWMVSPREELGDPP